ncbi:MAG: THUMP domain-containing protein [Promethearchaeota archaeon]
MPNLLLFLSGENETIPASECLAILDSEGIPYSNVERLDQALLVTTDDRACEAISRRAAMAYFCCRLLYRARADEFDAEDINAGSFGIEPGKKFAVRVRRVKEYSENLRVLELEKQIGLELINQFPDGVHVDLKNPDYTFFGLITSDEFLFGLIIGQVNRKGFGRRKGRNRPYFYPGVIEPRLARAMVNLSRVTAEDVFLDPFSGTGGLLIEAGLLGCSVVGTDLDMKMVRGSIRNLKHFIADNYSVILGDARRLPLSCVGGIATDPPYGISASTKGEKVEKLITEFMENTSDVLKVDGYLCLACPSTVSALDLEDISKLDLYERHTMYIHRSLTRQILVFRK